MVDDLESSQSAGIQPAPVQPDAPREPASAVGLTGPQQTPSAPAPDSMNIQSLGQPEYNPGANDEAGLQEKGIAPSRFEQLKTVLKQTSDASLIGIPGFMDQNPGSALRANAQKNAAADDKAEGVANLTPDEANKQFPGMPVPFNTGISPRVAQIQYDDFQRRQGLEAWKQRGGPLPWGLEGATGLVGGLFDPANLALMLGTEGVGSALKGITAVGTAVESAVASGGLKAIAEEVGKNYVTNVGINVATGVPNYLQQKAEHQDVHASEAITEGLSSAAVMTGFHFAVIKPLMGLLSSSVENMRKLPRDQQADNFKGALMDHENGNTIDTSAAKPEFDSRMRGEIPDHPQEAYQNMGPDRPTYYGARDSLGDPHTFLDLGGGRSLIDDKIATNHMVSDPRDGNSGKIETFHSHPDENLLNIEQAADSPEVKPFHDAVEEQTGVKLDVQPGESIKDVLSRIGEAAVHGDAPHDVLDQIQNIAREEGFNGYKGVLDVEGGEPKNLKHLFDEREPNQVERSNPEITPTQPTEQVSPQNDQSNAAHRAEDYSPELEKEGHDLRHGPSLNTAPEYMDPFVEEQYKAARAQLDKLAEEDAALKKEINDVLNRDNTTDNQEKSIIQRFTDCVLGSMV